MKRNEIQIIWNMSGERFTITPAEMLQYIRLYGRNAACMVSVKDSSRARKIIEYSAPGEETARYTAGEFWYQVFCMIENDGADDNMLHDFACMCRVI